MAVNEESLGVSRQSRRIWEGNIDLNERCTMLFVDSINNGGRTGSTLKKKFWLQIATQLNEEFGKTLIPKQIRNRWDSLRKKYNTWKYLRNLTGHAYDPTTGMFDFPPDKWVEIIASRPNAKEFKTMPLANVAELAYLYDAADSPGTHTHCLNEDGAPPRREFNRIPDNPQNEEMDEDEPENIGTTQNDGRDSYWEHLTFNLGGTQTETPSPSPSPSPSSSTAANRKRKGTATTNMESLMGVIEGGFGYFQADSEAQKQEREADRAERERRWIATEKARETDRAERERQWAATELDRYEERVERRAERLDKKKDRAEKRADRQEEKEFRNMVRAEEEAYSINEVLKALREMNQLNMIDKKFIRKITPKLCEQPEYRKGFLGSDNLEAKLWFLQILSGEDSDG